MPSDRLEATLPNQFTNTRDTISFLDHEDFYPIKDPEQPYLMEIQEQLGEGGMGIVYLAKEEIPKRFVAVKRLRPDRLQLKPFLIREAMIMGRLEHPCIIPVHRLETAVSETPEVVMKRVQGKSLWNLIEEKELTDEWIREVLSILMQVCNALGFAHSKGVFHRDIKPDNIMVGAFGEVYLLDWGIAVEKDKEDELPVVLVGSPAYMAPEMLCGDPKQVDQRTDVYLLGATLHEVITGHPRHQAEELNDVLDEVSVSRSFDYPDSIPQELGSICNRACEQKTVNRFQNVAELNAALESYLLHWEAIRISQVGEQRKQQFLALVEQKSKDVKRLDKCYYQARFGFEQALHIWPDCVLAQKGQQELLYGKAHYHLQENQLGQAEELVGLHPELLELLQEELASCRLRKLEEEQELQRLQDIGRKNDPRISRFSRGFLSLVILGILVSFIYCLWFTPLGVIEGLTSETLFWASVALFSPGIMAIGIFRRALFVNFYGARAAGSFVTLLLGVIIHQGIAFYLNVPPFDSVVVDMLLISLVMVGTYPSFRCGPFVALVSLSTIPILLLDPNRIALCGTVLSVVMALAIIGEWLYNEQKEAE